MLYIILLVAFATMFLSGYSAHALTHTNYRKRLQSARKALELQVVPEEVGQPLRWRLKIDLSRTREYGMDNPAYAVRGKEKKRIGNVSTMKYPELRGKEIRALEGIIQDMNKGEDSIYS